MRFSGQKVPKTKVFCNFDFLGATLCGNPAVECQKLKVFCVFFWPGAPPLRENKGEVSKTEGFLRFGCARICPENCPDDLFCYIRTFFKRAKMSEIRQKTSKTEGFFYDFFMFEATLCGNQAVECQKLRVFCDFGVPESVLTTCFATYGLLQGCSEMPRDGFRGA